MIKDEKDSESLLFSQLIAIMTSKKEVEPKRLCFSSTSITSE